MKRYFSILILILVLIGLWRFGLSSDRTKGDPVEPMGFEKNFSRSNLLRAADVGIEARVETAPLQFQKVPRLALATSSTISEQERMEIRQLIRDLALIEGADNNLHFALSDGKFRPLRNVDDLLRPEPFMPNDNTSRTDSQLLSRSPALTRLIELGPRSLPLLLDSLDDKTATKFFVNHIGGFSRMSYDSNFLGGNPLNPLERDVLNGPRREVLDKHVDSYPVTIGDLCYVAIGQIVGRDYRLFRDIPQALITITSPTTEIRLCQQVRDIWSSNNSAAKLLDSLLLDYATIVNGQSSSNWQTSSVMRLLYYFPRESAELIARRLDELDVSSDRVGRSWSGEFVKAVSWSDEPVIKAALARIFDRALNPTAAAAAARSVAEGNEARIRKRLSLLIAGLSPENADPHGDCYKLLVALGQFGDIEAKETFQRYLDVSTTQHFRLTCLALRKVRSEWAAELLVPLLENHGKSDIGHEPNTSPIHYSGEIRICDEAAETIVKANQNLTFETRKNPAVRDEQIRVIRGKLRTGQFID